MARVKAVTAEPATLAQKMNADGDRRTAMAAVASRFSGWRPAKEVLTKVRAVPTDFPYFDLVTKIGGFPIERPTLVHGPSNHGKAQPLDEPVLTPNGWVEIGKLKVGDFVIGSDGLTTEVTGVFPQGEREVFSIVFDDGGTTRACAEHLWFTTEKYERGDKRRGRVRNTAQIAATLHLKHSVGFVEPVEFGERDLPIDPYVLGLLLGDGCFVKSSIEFCKNDSVLHETLEKWVVSVGDWLTDSTSKEHAKTSLIVRGEQGSKVVPETRRRLETMGLVGKYSHDKFVPTEYLFASVKQRLALLQGLMDTDGSTGVNGQAQYCSVSPMLRDAVVHLTRSLGGRAYTYPKVDCKYTVHSAWNVMISFPNEIVPFVLERKAVLWNHRKKKIHRRIVTVNSIGRAECVCIRVAAKDSLYVTRDFVLTHNTEFCLGVGKSFLDRGHFFALLDAEHATPERWLRQLGIDMSHPGFHAKRPLTYEDAVAALEAWATAIGEARIKREIPEDTTGVVVIDSIGKLCPESLMKEMEVAFAADMAEAKLKTKKGIDGAGGRAGQILAARNNAWMRRIVPLAGHTGVAVVIITRENENTDSNMYAEEFTVTGGKAINYDASLALRILRSGHISQGEGADKKIFGERHKVIIRKTKVARKEDRQPTAYFNSSNGMLDGVPAGFDTVRDYLETAIEIGLVEQPTKGRYEFGNVKLGHGEHNVVKRLYTEPVLYESLRLAVRDSISKIIAAEPGESDE